MRAHARMLWGITMNAYRSCFGGDGRFVAHGLCVRGAVAALALFFLALTAGGPVAHAQEASSSQVRFEDLPGPEAYGDFVVGPGKIELVMQPGEERTVDIRVSNRMGEKRAFSVQVEDFGGSQDVKQPVILYGAQRGPYSLRDYIFPVAREIEIEHAKRAVIPVKVAIPQDAEPGGKYGSVLISVASKPDEDAPTEGAVTGAAIISRVGVLFFVRVTGDVKEEAQLTDFRTKGEKTFFQKGPIPFEIYFENTGNVHVNPSGVIQVKNMAGQVVGEQEMEPWFTLPGSKRVREISWDRPLLIGKYTALLFLNRGYDDLTDTREVSFWVVPFALIAWVLAGLLIFFFVLRFFLTKVEIKIKSD